MYKIKPFPNLFNYSHKQTNGKLVLLFHPYKHLYLLAGSQVTKYRDRHFLIMKYIKQIFFNTKMLRVFEDRNNKNESQWQRTQTYNKTLN